MKSLSVLYGESFLTTSIAGSRTRPTSGVRSFSETFASARMRGLVIHRPVYTAMVCASPFFSFARKAIAVAPPPPVLLTTCMRTGRSFSFSIAAAMARANTSPPPPGPV